MIDLNKAKVGDKVTFRCGGEAVIGGIRGYGTHSSESKMVHFNAQESYGIIYHADGTPVSNQSILDITAIESVFNWDDAKSGMCFIFLGNSDNVYYIGKDFRDEKNVIVSLGEECYDFACFRKDALIRHPEGDIKPAL